MNQAFGPYSPIKQAGDYYYVSGQVGVNPETKVAKRSIEEQTKQVMENLLTVLESSGLTSGDVVKTTIYLTDIGYYQTVNDIYVKYFEAPRPARAAVGVEELPRVAKDCELLIELEAVAYKAGSS